MRFLITTKPCETDARKAATRPFDAALFSAYMKFNEEMAKAGVLVVAEGLNPDGFRARVVLDGSKRAVVDGPFAETKEVLGGFYVIEVASKEEAVDWALRHPAPLGAGDLLEIRQLTELSDLEPKYQALIAEAAPTWSAPLWRTERKTA